jgi:dipeptidyl aminopeptidase/acylaminoacyl peptidase
MTSKVHPYAKLVKEALDLIGIEQYGLHGVVRGERLLVTGFLEGKVDAYLYDGSILHKLNREPIDFLAEAPYNSSRAIIGRDVGRGKETFMLYEIDLDEPGVEKEFKNMAPTRIFGVAYDEEKAVFSGVTEKGIAIFEYAHGKTEKVIDSPGLAAVTSLRNNLVTGTGFFEGTPGKTELFWLDLEKKDFQIYTHEGSVSNALVTPKSEIIFSVELKDHAELLKLNPKTMQVERLELPYKDLDNYKPISFINIDFLPNGSLMVIAQRDGRSKIFVDGKEIAGPVGYYTAAFMWKNTLVATYTNRSTPPRIISLKEDGKPETLLSGKLPEWFRDIFDTVDFHYVPSKDGLKVPTLVMFSKRAGKPGPTVILVHGGPWAEYLDSWSTIASSLVTAGYNVVMPNYRGSTGYGLDWRLKIVGDPCGMELEDIVSAAEWAREKGIASDLYIMGYSYGGYMTMCALTRKPGVFKAGVAGASVVDWEMMYGLSDPAFKQFIEILFAGKKELWRERSPINYIENLKEPLVIIHSQNDSRTPLQPILRFMSIALEKGKSFEAHIAPDMGHMVSTAEDVVNILLPALLFLERHRS